MKIIELTAENIKRLRAVDITPAEHVQVIGGRNAQGKTSVLDALWLALGGGTASKGTTRPIRDGEDQASVRLDLGDLVVTRTWKGERTTLTVASADGAKYSGPQSILDALVGRLSFDPLEFTRLSAREQVAALLDIANIDVDLDTLARDRKAIYDERAEVGRQGKALGAVSVDATLPTEETSATAILGEIRAAQEANREADEAHRVARHLRAGYENQKSAVARLAAELAEAESALQRQADALTEQDELAENMQVFDTAPLEDRLAKVEETNAAIRANNAARATEERRVSLRDKYAALTSQIEALDQAKADALAAASFPVAGLGFDDSGVTYNGVPFSQASSAEQIRVSLAMAMSLNPKLRVIRILDGSLLDADNLALIESMAREHDYQVWIERVGNADEGAVIIEDGAVA